MAVGFGLFAPATLFILPLAALLIASRPRTGAERLAAALAGGISLGWLLAPGELPEQVVRAAAVLTTTAFVAASFMTRATFIHRALFALAVAALGIAALFLWTGWSWEELHWWVEHRTGYATRVALAQLRAAGRGAEAASEGALGTQLDAWLASSVAFVADHFPALVALQALGGLALATAFYHRLASQPRGLGLGRFSDFRFTEQLGWAAAIPLVVLLFSRLVRWKIVATNTLLLVGTLYAFRGVAVAVFGAALTGGGPLATVFAITAAVFMLPVVVGGAILLGVLDAGLDLRGRWRKPTARG
ncbi:MAG: DUF2232 domain-containing protein [Gemmatimonadetes bacterium]|nr:DUF2232 domain-containing protein [Gemmatimonadota bacterium]